MKNALRRMRFLGFSLLLLSAQSAHAETLLCIPEKPENPVYLIDDIEGESPKLSVQFGNGKAVNGLPCTAAVPRSAFDCEQFAGEAEQNRYFEFIRDSTHSKRYLVQLTGFQLRAKPENGVLHKLRPGGLEAYNCRDKN